MLPCRLPVGGEIDLCMSYFDYINERLAEKDNNNKPIFHDKSTYRHIVYTVSYATKSYSLLYTKL